MNYPFVSVIIPVFNDEDRLMICLDSLHKQTYPKENFEIVVIDNGSSNPVASKLKTYTNVRCFDEPVSGSYRARNTGIRHALGQIIAFTDSDCIPSIDWIENGVKALSSMKNPGIAAGRIDVFFKDPKRPTWVELFEKEFAFNQEGYVKNQHFGATANVFTTTAVIEKAGLFDESLKSGGDMEWGKRVFNAGFDVIYADEVKVDHPARCDIKERFVKTKRTALGHYSVNKDSYFSTKNILALCIPPKKMLVQLIKSNKQDTAAQKLKVAGFLMTSRWYTALVRVQLRLFGK